MSKKAKKKTTTKRKGTPRTPPYPNYQEWTTARFWSFIRSALRSAYNKYPPKFEVLKAARRAYDGPDKRMKWEFQCAECGEWFKSKDVSVDHKVPAGSLSSYEDLPGFAERLFCGVDGLQVLCTEDHKKKTALEREENKKK